MRRISLGVIACLLKLAAPDEASTKLCKCYFSGGIGWKASEICGRDNVPHLVPGDGPLACSRSCWTGKLRYDWNGQCNTSEIEGVIPGKVSEGRVFETSSATCRTILAAAC